MSPLANARQTEQSKRTFLCLALTHRQQATPTTHKSERYQRRGRVRDAQLCPCALQSRLISLFTTWQIPMPLEKAVGVASTGLGPVCGGCVDGRCRLTLRNGTLRHVLPAPTYDLRQEEAAADGRGEKKKKKRTEVSGYSGGMSRVGNLSVSTHVSTPASCGSGTVHLSACVSARLAVWHPLLPTLPDFEREQSHYFSHGDEAQPLIYPPTHSHWRVLQGMESPPDKRMRFLFHGFSVRVFTIHTVHNEESLQHKKRKKGKRMQQSRHTQTQR